MKKVKFLLYLLIWSLKTSDKHLENSTDLSVKKNLETDDEPSPSSESDASDGLSSSPEFVSEESSEEESSPDSSSEEKNEDRPYEDTEWRRHLLWNELPKHPNFLKPITDIPTDWAENQRFWGYYPLNKLQNPPEIYRKNFRRMGAYYTVSFWHPNQKKYFFTQVKRFENADSFQLFDLVDAYRTKECPRRRERDAFIEILKDKKLLESVVISAKVDLIRFDLRKSEPDETYFIKLVLDFIYSSNDTELVLELVKLIRGRIEIQKDISLLRILESSVSLEIHKTILKRLRTFHEMGYIQLEPSMILSIRLQLRKTNLLEAIEEFYRALPSNEEIFPALLFGKFFKELSNDRDQAILQKIKMVERVFALEEANGGRFIPMFCLQPLISTLTFVSSFELEDLIKNFILTRCPRENYENTLFSEAPILLIKDEVVCPWLYSVLWAGESTVPGMMQPLDDYEEFSLFHEIQDLCFRWDFYVGTEQKGTLPKYYISLAVIDEIKERIEEEISQGKSKEIINLSFLDFFLKYTKIPNPPVKVSIEEDLGRYLLRSTTFDSILKISETHNEEWEHSEFLISYIYWYPLDNLRSSYNIINEKKEISFIDLDKYAEIYIRLRSKELKMVFLRDPLALLIPGNKVNKLITEDMFSFLDEGQPLNGSFYDIFDDYWLTDVVEGSYEGVMMGKRYLDRRTWYDKERQVKEVLKVLPDRIFKSRRFDELFLQRNIKESYYYRFSFPILYKYVYKKFGLYPHSFRSDLLNFIYKDKEFRKSVEDDMEEIDEKINNAPILDLYNLKEVLYMDLDKRYLKLDFSGIWVEAVYLSICDHFENCLSFDPVYIRSLVETDMNNVKTTKMILLWNMLFVYDFQYRQFLEVFSFFPHVDSDHFLANNYYSSAFARDFYSRRYILKNFGSFERTPGDKIDFLVSNVGFVLLKYLTEIEDTFVLEYEDFLESGQDFCKLIRGRGIGFSKFESQEQKLKAICGIRTSMLRRINGLEGWVPQDRTELMEKFLRTLFEKNSLTNRLVPETKSKIIDLITSIESNNNNLFQLLELVCRVLSKSGEHAAENKLIDLLKNILSYGLNSVEIGEVLKDSEEILSVDPIETRQFLVKRFIPKPVEPSLEEFLNKLYTANKGNPNSGLPEKTDLELYIEVYKLLLEVLKRWTKIKIQYSR